MKTTVLHYSSMEVLMSPLGARLISLPGGYDMLVCACYFYVTKRLPKSS